MQRRPRAETAHMEMSHVAGCNHLINTPTRPGGDQWENTAGRALDSAVPRHLDGSWAWKMSVVCNNGRLAKARKGERTAGRTTRERHNDRILT